MKRFFYIEIVPICLLVALLLCSLSMISCENEGEKLAYIINSDFETCTVTGLGEYTSKNLVIPDTINGYKVTRIADYAFRGSDIISFKCSENIMYIGKGAFQDCKQLKRAFMPNKLDTIAEYTFACCDNLSYIRFPNNLKVIGKSAFDHCGSLCSVSIPQGTVTIGERAFYMCTGLTSINIPNGVKIIDNAAFLGCSFAQNINIPDSVTKIGSQAFGVCLSLEEIFIPASVTEIGASPLGCNYLTKITVDENNPELSSINGNLYYGNNTIFANYAGGKPDTSFKIPEGVIEIGATSFSCCDNLKEIYIPNTVKYIGNAIFYMSANIEKLFYDGTIDEWNSITKVDDWNAKTDSVFSIICSDGTIAMDGTVTYK